MAYQETFASLGLAKAVHETLDAQGYSRPTPVQARSIPVLLSGSDLVAQAQTGTGKTAAFALPILDRIDLTESSPQALVLAPTRELALQVSGFFERYGANLGGLRVLTVYGGQGYGPQINGLRRGAHVVVGTPGRLLDHVRKGTLRLEGIRTFVLDEADEMLRMGFLEDVETLLAGTSAERQIALFSATMPPPIRRIADRYLRNPVTVTVKVERPAAAQIRQRSWIGNMAGKLDALVRILEVEEVDGTIVFVQTKAATVQVTDVLAGRGIRAEALSGDVAQDQRERIVESFRKGRFDVLVATDVAARGLDVERVSHVVNFDAPTDPGTYVHRIGRTGRAGRTGEAIVFLHPRESHLVARLERAASSRIEKLQLPSVADVNTRRVERFEARITEALEAKDRARFAEVVSRYCERTGTDPIDAAAAIAVLGQGKSPLFLEASPAFAHPRKAARPGPVDRDRPRRVASAGPRRETKGLVPYRVEVGRQHGVQPGNLVGAITGESGLDGSAIGRIQIEREHSLVDLPEDLPEAILKRIGRIFVSGQKLRLRPQPRRAA